MSDFHFRVVPYESCVEEVIAFRNANRELARDRRYFEWRYERRPCRQKAMIVWGFDSQSHKVAAASIIPHDFYVLEGVFPVGVLGDISVVPECRGRGVATRMLHFLREEPAFHAMRACVVLPNDEASHALERAGWRNATAIARFVKVVDIGPRLPGWLGGRSSAAGISRTINFLSRFASLDGWYSYRTSPYHVAEIGEFNDGFDDLWNEIPKRGRVLTVRDRSYLHWRYHEHPTVRCRGIEIRHGQRLRGYVVFHVAADVVEIDDFLAADATVGLWLIKEFLAYVRQGRLAANIYVRYNANSFLAIPWNRFGFVRRRDFHRVMASVSRTETYLSLPSKEGFWFVTAGDKDV